MIYRTEGELCGRNYKTVREKSLITKTVNNE